VGDLTGGIPYLEKAQELKPGDCPNGYDLAVAASGINVNGMASTPNNVAVGGTDFADTFFNQNSTYWSATNGKCFNSALSYIPEIPWNESCAGQLITTYLGFATPYGTGGLCNSPLSAEYLPLVSAAEEGFLSLLAGGGGPSACAFGTPSIYGVVGGTCQGTLNRSTRNSLWVTRETVSATSPTCHSLQPMDCGTTGTSSAIPTQLSMGSPASGLLAPGLAVVELLSHHRSWPAFRR
jgi:hypothetical protein